MKKKHPAVNFEDCDEFQRQPRRIINENSKLHTCPTCDKKFLKINYLTKHMVMHKGKQFACDQCNHRSRSLNFFFILLLKNK